MERKPKSMMEPIIKIGRNCWRKERAERAAFIVDAADYFKALESAANRAVKSLYIAAWDIDSRTVLDPEGGGECLGDFLNRLAADKPELDIHILSWDFSMLYLLERDILPLFNLGWKAHRRIQFRMDGEHPVGASQHQKIVVVDDALAFCGGIDITKNRWDTPEHRVHDPRRLNANHRAYRPFHDVQVAVAGPVAAALGDLFRERWQRVTGKPLKRKAEDLPAPWPEDLSPDLIHADVAIARTSPAYKGYPEVLEVKALYEDAIASARETLYVENQYLTSRAVTHALADSLRQEHGPEIVLVLPGESDGWLEQGTMDNLRRHVLEQLLKVDRKDRLRVYRPVLDREGTSPVVHSKVMIVDDRLIRVGSSNLNNRSLGLDAECDLAVEAGDDQRIKEAAAGLRNRLLAEHLGTDSREVERVFRETGSLIKAIDALRGKERSLEPLSIEGGFWENQGVMDIPFVDPEYPAALDELMDRFLMDEEEPEPSRRPIFVFLSVIGAFLLLAALWWLTPLGEWLGSEQLVAWGGVLKGSFGMPLGILAAYVAGGVLVFPVTVLHAATGVLFPFPEGFLYALTGSTLSAAATYGLGLFLGKDAVRRLAGKRLNRLSRRLVRKGWLTVLVARNVPLVPFSVMNIIVGASKIRFWDYLIGTALGMAPGILVVTVFSDRLFRLIEEPNWINLVWVCLVILVLGGSAWWLKWRLTRSG